MIANQFKSFFPYIYFKIPDRKLTNISYRIFKKIVVIFNFKRKTIRLCSYFNFALLIFNKIGSSFILPFI